MASNELMFAEDASSYEDLATTVQAVKYLKKGWLHKLSYRGKGWKKRYVEVTDNLELRYGRMTRTPGNPSESGFELKGVISLEDAEIIEMRASQFRVDGHEDRFPFIFKVSSQRSVSVKHGQWWIYRDYCFAAVDEPELQSWIETFKSVCIASDAEMIDNPWTTEARQYPMFQAADLVPLSKKFIMTTQNNMAHATRKLAEGMHSLLRQLADGTPPAAGPADTREARSRVWVLGCEYSTGPASPRGGGIIGGATALNPGQQQFLDDVHSRLWFTYRAGFERIKPSNLTSDTGWGCMLRSGQMMLAQALVSHYLRRDWRLKRNQLPPSKYVDILRWFEDADKPSAPFSIHRIAQAGVQYEKQVGQWFGPDTICRALRSLWTTAYTRDGVGPCKTAGYLLVEDRTIYRNLAEAAAGYRPAYPGQGQRTSAGQEACSWRGLVVMAPVRLGTQAQINTDYIARLAAYLRLPQSIGFIGGRPRHSYYFIGVRGSQCYYLDPHTTQAHVPLALHKAVDCSSFHCGRPETMPMAHLDPSLALGFYCDDKSDFDDLYRRVARLAREDRSPILSVAEEAPDYMTDDISDIVDVENGDEVVLR